MQTTTLRMKLVEQYQRATVDSGRYERVERERFLLHLVNRLEEHQHLLAVPVPAFNAQAPWESFQHARAARLGRDMAATFSFITGELVSRMGVEALREALARIGSRTALALSRRLAAPLASSGVRLAALRYVTGTGAPAVSALNGAMLDFGECARCDLRPAPHWRDPLELAVAIDNHGPRPAWYPCVEIRVQAQTEAGGLLRQTSLGVFGALPRVAPRSRAWFALRGVDLLGELRAELASGEDIHAIRLLISRK